MKRIFTIIAVLAAALALPAVAGAAGPSESASQGSNVDVQSAIELGTTGQSEEGNDRVVTDADLEGLTEVSTDASAIGFSQDIDIRSNAGFTISLAIGGTAADFFDAPDTVTSGSNGAENAGNTYQDETSVASGGVSWADNAGEYEGTATITATNSY